jgi:hypothetical protein
MFTPKYLRARPYNGFQFRIISNYPLAVDSELATFPSDFMVLHQLIIK